MPRTNSGASRGDSAQQNGVLHSSEVSDETVTQVGKAVTRIVMVRRSLEADIATAQTDDERQAMLDQAQSAAMRAISDQGLTVSRYNEVIAATEADDELEERVLVACRAA